MPLLDDVATRLAADGMGTVKTSSNDPASWPIYKGAGTAGNRAEMILLVAGPGEGVIEEMTATVGAAVAEIPTLVVSVRNADPSAAIVKAEAIWRKLHNLAEVTLGSTRYLRIEARQKPFAIGRDESNRHIVTCNYVVTKEIG